MNTYSSIVLKQHSHQTPTPITKDDWLIEGLTPEIESTIEASFLLASRQSSSERIKAFVNSFKPSRLRKTLENSYILRVQCDLNTTAGLRSGLSLILHSSTNQEHRFLQSKIKQLYYRLHQIDDKIEFLLLLTPTIDTINTIDITNGQSIQLVPKLHKPDSTTHTTPNYAPDNSSWSCISGEYGWSSDRLTDVIDYCWGYISFEAAYNLNNYNLELSDTEERTVFQNVEQKCLVEGRAEGENWAIWHGSLDETQNLTNGEVA